MKFSFKLFIIPVFAAMISVNASSETLDLTTLTLSEEEVSQPVREVKSDGSVITVSYTIPSCELVKETLKLGVYSCHIPGFSQTVGIRKAAVPERMDKLFIPWKSKCQLVLVDSVYVEYPCRLIASKPLIDPEGKEIYFDHISDSSDNAYIGDAPVAICGDQYMRGNRILSVRVRPVVYDAAQSKIRILKKLTFSILKSRYKYGEMERSNSLKDIPRFDGELLSNMVLNYSDVLSPDYPAVLDTVGFVGGRYEEYCEEDPQSYIILSTSKFKKAIDKLVEWKRTLGFKTYVQLQDNWTSAQIKDKVKELYNADENLRYLLIVGDDADVPSHTFEQVGNIGNLSYGFYSDNIYGRIDGDDDYTQDIFVGRIPVSTLLEANIYVDKLISYETDPPQELGFYQTVTGIGGFYADSGIAGKDAPISFIETAEVIRKHVNKQKVFVPSKSLPIGFPCRMDRIYYAGSYENPTTWYNGDTIPISLQRPNFAWDGNAERIKSQFNKGSMLAFVNAHGAIDGWGRPNFRVGDANGLDNGNKLPLVLTPLSCSLGRFKGDCIAEAFIRNPNGGALAMVANTNYGYGYFGDVILISMIRNIWPKPDIKVKLYGGIVNISRLDQLNRSTYTLGPLLANALSSMEVACPYCIDHRNYLHNVTHLFGDPGMELQTAPPAEYNDLSVKLNEAGEVTVSTFPIQSVRVSYYDKKTGEVGRYIGTGVKFTPINLEQTVICVKSHNYKTKIFTYDDLQDSAISQTSLGTASNIVIKSISPSPAFNYINVVLDDRLQTRGLIVLTGINTGSSKSVVVESGISEITIDVSELRNDTYVLSLKDDIEVLDSKKIIINH